jgi:cell wall assembly regulator SMI1
MLVRDLFAEYVEWLGVNVPHAHANLAPGAGEADIQALEAGIGARLPEDVRTVLGMHNGQRETMVPERLDPAVPCLPTLMFLSTDLILRAWRMWQEIGDVIDGSVLPGAEGVIKPLYSSPGWIPLWSDRSRPTT